MNSSVVWQSKIASVQILKNCTYLTNMYVKRKRSMREEKASQPCMNL